MEGTDISRAEKYLNSVEWPKELRAGFKIHRESGLITIGVNKLDWMLMSPEDVIRATETINKTMSWLISNGYMARLESVVV